MFWLLVIEDVKCKSLKIVEFIKKMNSVVISLVICLLIVVDHALSSAFWCYHEPSCSDAMWSIIADNDCNGTQQSPIDIKTSTVKANANLTSLTFIGYDDETALTEIKNTGTTVQVTLDDEKMHVEGGDLPGLFSSTQFHLHWGNGSDMPGSEHTVDGKRYPMELHIVNKAVRDNGSVSSDSALAVLGVFIEATNETGKPESWNALTSYLVKIPNAGDKVRISHNISMDDLFVGVDRASYYRYLGSTTTPNCKEGIVWTIFKDPIKVSQDLIDLFSRTVYINKTTNSPRMTNTFRSVQPINSRTVTSQVAGTRSLGPIKPTSAAGHIKPTSAADHIKPTSAATNPSQSLMCLVLLFCILPFF